MADVTPTYPPFPLAGYQQLAEFRYRIRRFLHFSEQTARSHGIEPQQHQLMLTIKGLPEGTAPTVTALAARLCLRHHSTVELINRLVERGAAVRRQAEKDRRQVLVELTPLGEELLQKLATLHWQEVQQAGPRLSDGLNELIENTPAELTDFLQTERQTMRMSPDNQENGSGGESRGQSV